MAVSPTALERKYRRELFREVGKYLSQKRQSCALTQEMIARKSGYSSQFVSNVERGSAFPPPTLLTAMIEAYGITEQEFLGVLTFLQLEYYKRVYFPVAKSAAVS